ncbi:MULTISPECIES: sodium:proton antiporter [unclassified Corynebacterium]|uniref:cation:proton antiporter n=1 Tax=unclassified Corynebacterium TaxID=2624378 RepID=UPI0029C9E594|nr:MULTISPECIES: sodium:proton antiporter [unclassified Corynebacterium]WPF67069.1 sodium:proton antiporter [Corynebacterium sp. 22KM0430]WPF69557.1 sodium:proton antiporter [Corynebacterium sp. 21KM1197]
MTILLMLCGLLLATVIVVALGERLGLPWPVLLTLVAAGGVFLPVPVELDIPAELMLPIFLPPLLWALARRTSWSVIKTQFSTIVWMSVLLVFATIAALTGSILLLLPSVGVAGAIVLAAALAPPDPVAVDAVAEPVGIPKRITTSLQTEGLFNDAASIVAFHVALGAALAGSELSWLHGLGSFAWSVAGAVIIGLAVGRGAAWFTDHVDNTAARNAFTWVLPFAVYILAEEVATSGVIAIVIAAVEMNSRASLGAEDRLSGEAFWEPVEMLFTGVAFGLIGLNVRAAIDEVGADIWHAVWVGLALSAVAMIVRFAWLSLALRNNTRKNREFAAPLRRQEVLLMTWAGMHGLVTLALVLSIPASISATLHHEAAVIALVVLLCTMVIPGLTLPWLMGRLNLEAGPDAAGDEALEALRRRAWQAAYGYMRQEAQHLPPEATEAMSGWLERQFDKDEDRREELSRWREAAGKVRLGALQAAQAELLTARSERGANPAHVDEVLASIDRMLVAAKR